MAVTERKKKKPPTFHYLPRDRGKQIKKSWVEDHKIRSKWKAQKRREGLSGQISVSAEDTSYHDKTNASAQSATSRHCPDKSSLPISTPSHDEKSLRDLRKIAYSSKPLRSQNSGSSHSESARGRSYNDHGSKASVRRETGQPNMKLRMNVLFERIKRDLS